MKNIYISAVGGLFSGTDNTPANSINDFIRGFFSLLDKAAYGLLGIIYEIFFNVSSAELFTNATIKNFYSRVQLIIGVFMVFKLAITIMQGIVNPDKFTDKNNGFASIITRVVFALVMLTLLVPINIPGAKTEYEIQLNNNGLLFGTLYSLQNRLLSNNTLGRLILGTTDESITTTNNDDDTLSGADKQAESIKKSANVFTTTILKGFLRINLVPESEREVPANGKSDETVNNNRMCTDINDETLDIYKQLDASPDDLLSLVNANCTASSNDWAIIKAMKSYKKYNGTERYVFCYIPIISTIVALVFAFILVGFTVDIAVRAVKLAVLRLIAPIPIISYIEPKQAKEGAFAAWVKTLTSTYLDLFLRLAIVYFVIFLIQDMIVNGIVINTGTGGIGIISAIFIWLGLFFFARQAPKFIKDVLGLKGPGMSNIGLSAMLAGAGTLRAGGNFRDTRDAMRTATQGQIDAFNSGKAAPGIGQSFNMGRDLAAQRLTGDDKMTYDRMRRGRSFLASEGITSQSTEAAKQRMYDAQNAATAAANNHNRFSNNGWNALTKQEQDAIENAYRTDNGVTIGPLSSAQQDEMQKSYADAYLQNIANSAQSKAGKAESEYKKMDSELNRWGGGQSYRASHTTRSNATTLDNLRHPVRTARYLGEDVVRGISNVPGTIGDAARDAVNWHGDSDRMVNRQAHNFNNNNRTDMDPTTGAPLGTQTARNNERATGLSNPNSGGTPAPHRDWAEDQDNFHNW